MSNENQREQKHCLMKAKEDNGIIEKDVHQEKRK